MDKRIFSVGDYVISDIFKMEKGLPYIIKIKSIDENYNVINFDYKSEENYIGTQSLRFATKFEKFFGPIYDFLVK
jgi:hypothetical protein